MKFYKSPNSPIPGTSHTAVIRLARQEYHKIQKLTPRRQAYVRSQYFAKDKIFINLFWEHLRQKHYRDQIRRAKLFICAIDLIRHTNLAPEVVIEKTIGAQLYRFYGQTKTGLLFCVQVKHDIRTDRKDFISAFPVHKDK